MGEFEPEFGQKRERVRKIRKAGPLTKAVLAISLLVNLSGLIVWGVMRYLEETVPRGDGERRANTGN